MKVFLILGVMLLSNQGYSYEAQISCSTADYRCNGGLCGWWMNGVSDGDRPSRVKLEPNPNPWYANSWIGKYSDEHNGYKANVTIMISLKDQTNAVTFYNSIELVKDGFVADSNGYSSSFAEHVEVGLRGLDNTGVKYLCMINLVE